VKKLSIASVPERASVRDRRDASPFGLPARVGRYQLTEPLGVGGMAEVYKATSTGPGGFERTVVIKRILPASSADPTFVRMFVAEAKILGMLNHPNVVQAYDFGEADGTLFLVLEYADGPSLYRAMEILRRTGRTVPVVIAAHFAHEICRALDYVHRLNGSDGEPLRVVHRDVTPSNIVLTSAGALKLLDFGVARSSASAANSEHGTIRGKAAYLAPEAVKGNPIDGRVDIFALGVVLHEMLTLTDLFGSESSLTTLYKVLEMEVPRPSERRPDVPPELDAIVMKALERDPARRYACAADMARDLNDFVISSRLRIDDVVEFVRDVQIELAKQRRLLPVRIVAEARPPAPWDDRATLAFPERRSRMSRLRRFLFRWRGKRRR
jgi:eukaryotic-like serine/threonine-protein kinase